MDIQPIQAPTVSRSHPSAGKTFFPRKRDACRHPFNRKPLSLGIAGAIGVLSAVGGLDHAMAAESGKNEPNSLLDPVSITATTDYKSSLEVPASVTVVSKTNIENRRVSRVGDALREVPGLYLRGSTFGTFNPGTSFAGIALRGIGGGARNLIMQDGLPLNSTQAGTVNFSNIFMDDIERVEVVSGPFSALYGSNAIGGVINAISKMPDKREIKVRGGYGGGDITQLWETAAVYRDKFENGWAVSLGVGYRDSSSYITDSVLKSATAGRSTPLVTGFRPAVDSQGNDTYLIGDKGKRPWSEEQEQLKLYYNFSDDTRLQLGFAHYSYDTNVAPYHTYLRDAQGNQIIGTPAGQRVGIVDGGNKRFTLRPTDFATQNPSSEEFYRYSLRLDHHFGGDVRLMSDFAVLDRNAWTPNFTTPNTGASVTSTRTNWDGGPGSLDVVATDRRLDGRIELSFPFKINLLPVLDEHRVVAGFAANSGELERNNYGVANWRRWWTGDYTGRNFASAGTSTTFSIYGQDEIRVIDKLSLYLGARLDDWSSSGRYRQYTNPTYSAKYEERGFTQLNPKASLVYRPLDFLTLRSSIGTAFRPPTLGDLYTPSLLTKTSPSGFRLTQANPDLRPESSVSWEFGAESVLPTGTSLKATYYETELRNMFFRRDIISGTTNDLAQLENAGKAKIQGAEFSLIQELTDWLYFTGNFSWTDARMKENAAEVASVGKRVTGVPEVMWNLALEANYGPFSGMVSGRYVGKAYSDSENKDTADHTFGVYDQFYLMDTKLSYEVYKGVRASFAVNNLLNEQYYQFYKMPGRTFFGEVSMAF